MNMELITSAASEMCIRDRHTDTIRVVPPLGQ